MRELFRLCLTTIVFAGDVNYPIAKTPAVFLLKQWRKNLKSCKRSRVKRACDLDAGEWHDTLFAAIVYWLIIVIGGQE